MQLRAIIRARGKNILDAGTWKADSKMPKSAFPLSKQRSFQIRAKYRWRITRFSCAGETFRILIAYRNDLERYSAYLGREHDGDMAVVSRYEFHPSHGGWHYHADCAHSSEIVGRTGGLDDRLPAGRSHHRRAQFCHMDDARALSLAYKAFGLLPRIDRLELT